MELGTTNPMTDDKKPFLLLIRCWQYPRKTHREPITISNMAAKKKLQKYHVTMTYVGHLVRILSLRNNKTGVPKSVIVFFEQNTDAYILVGQLKECTTGQSPKFVSSPLHLTELTPMGVDRLPNADP